MNDETPARAKSAVPQPEPLLDTSGDSDEPAFSWMAPAGGTPSGRDDAGDEAKAPQADSRAGRRAAEAAVGPSAAGTASGAGTAAAPAAAATAATAADGTGETREPRDSKSFNEPLPTSALHVRPPEEEVERRNAQRESAANAKPVAPRLFQVLLAIIYPFILLILAVRAVTSPLFLWVEYNRPGFPGDGYGFSTDDRMTYGSYSVDYLSNWAGPRYLGDLVQRSGEKLFKDGEVSHMADVKAVILSTFGAGTVLLILALVAIVYLRKRSNGGIRRALFAGSIITLVLILGLGTLAALGWQQFFTEFHRIFFADGSWTFSLDDTLIRLFPSQFWIDAGIGIGGMVLLASVITLVLTWPTRRRRGVARKERSVAGEEPAAAAEPVPADQP